MRSALFVSLVLCTYASHAEVSVFPGSPDSQTTIRVQVPQCAWHGDPSHKTGVDPLRTRVMMSGNKIDVTVVLNAPWGFLGCAPGLDLALGQLPPGNYQVEVIEKSGDGTSLGSQGITGFTVSPTAANRPNFNVTGLWWTPTESGWGVNIVQNAAGALFATWFVYAPDGSAAWYHMPSGGWEASGSFTGPVYRTTGPFFDGCPAAASTCAYVPFDPSRVTRTQVGTARFSFDPMHYGVGFMVLVVDGKQTSRGIQLLDF
jgi:hypothetical protein